MACNAWFCAGCNQCPYATTSTAAAIPTLTSTTTSMPTDGGAPTCLAQYCTQFSAGGWPTACSQWFCAKCLECHSGSGTGSTTRRGGSTETTTSGRPLTSTNSAVRTTAISGCPRMLCSTFKGGWQAGCRQWFCDPCSECQSGTFVASTTTSLAMTSSVAMSGCWPAVCGTPG